MLLVAVTVLVEARECSYRDCEIGTYLTYFESVRVFEIHEWADVLQAVRMLKRP